MPMGMSGELYRVSAERLRDMLADPGQVREEIYPDDSDLYAARRAERGLDIDKAWDGIDFLVRGLVRRGRIPWVDPVPWHAPVEGSETGAANHYGPICYRTPAQVAEIARALAAVTREDVEGVYDPQQMMADDVYPRSWDRPGELDFLWAHFRAVAAFYREAAARGEGVLLWLA
jgi:hypothetical protein